ncbi:hypothetical protein [Candidatus Nanohalovita haloferacivicina]|uniref:hypothetical protein n=1 Tax=Candidatus Nanohalovita haloferacivicina TaxID=2978046 RepID=UPI00325F954B|nr:hypothetical protein HBNXNv_0905 [Candidatus Nanohalobia archaeon BNXNv]
MKLKDKLKKAVKKKAWKSGKKIGKNYLKYKAVTYVLKKGSKALKKKLKRD